MAASVQCVYDLKMDIEETLGFGLDNFPDRAITHQKIVSGTLVAGTVPKVSKAWSDQVSLSGGSLTLDLTALTRGSLLSNVTFSGLRVQMLKLFCATANTASVVFKDGASNGTLIFGDSSGQITLPAGSGALFFFNNGLADISASLKTIDMTSSDADAIFDILLVAGASS